MTRLLPSSCVNHSMFEGVSWSPDKSHIAYVAEERGYKKDGEEPVGLCTKEYVDNEVSAIKRLEEFSNNQGEAKLIAADISTLGRLNHMNVIELWGTVLRESTECWCIGTWKMGHWLKMGLACHFLGITDLLHVLKCFPICNNGR
ncbi:putative receptor protein kinase ZmPK1 [Tanacetum coccineum]